MHLNTLFKLLCLHRREYGGGTILCFSSAPVISAYAGAPREPIAGTQDEGAEPSRNTGICPTGQLIYHPGEQLQLSWNGGWSAVPDICAQLGQYWVFV